MERVLYAELTPKDLLARLAKAPIAYLPLGTLEWHGPHLPLGADGIQPAGLFEALAREVGGVVLPMLFVGPDLRKQVNGKDLIGMDTNPMPQSLYPPQQFPGSAYWVDDELFVRLLDGVVAQLVRAGFRIIVGHGHGPSTDTFGKQAARWKAQYGIDAIHCWGPEEELGFQCDHAAKNETSITLAVRPELVQMENLPADGFPPGVGGVDPKTASAEHGRRILQAHIDRMKEILRERLALLQTPAGV